MSITFLSSPYSSKNEEEKQKRIKHLLIVADIIFHHTKDNIISPILHNISVKRLIDKEFDFWSSYCYSILDKCENMYVFMDDGWEKSTGVKGEITYAERHNIPIKYLKLEIEEDNYVLYLVEDMHIFTKIGDLKIG